MGELGGSEKWERGGECGDERRRLGIGEMEAKMGIVTHGSIIAFEFCFPTIGEILVALRF